MRTLLLASVLLGLLVRPGPAAAQGAPVAQRERMEEILGRSPMLVTSGNLAAEARFVQQARTLLSATPEGAEAARGIRTAQEATLALERALAGTSVRAVVRSTPSPIVVTYRRLVDEGAPELTITTNDSIPLQPALYVFTATDPGSGQVQEQKKSCATGCTVVFRFP